MKRKDYEKPTMQVVLMKQSAQLLTASGVKAVRGVKNGDDTVVPDYGNAIEDTWQE